jgi:hypothetical protein
MRLNIPRTRDWLLWLFVRPWLLWACVATLALAVSFVWACLWADAESRSRWAGTVLQLFGFVTTAIGIVQTRRQFGHRGIFESLIAWYGRRPKRSITIETGSGAFNIKGGSPIMAVGVGAAAPESSVEQRVARLEECVRLIERRANQIDQRASEEIAAREQGDADERHAREAADANLGTRLELSATGGLQLSALGLFWLMLGTGLAGFPPEIAAFVAPKGATAGHLVIYALQPYWPAICGVVYFAVAVAFSVFYSRNAIKIFTRADIKALTDAQRFHQCWLNFLGSAVGWLCVWFVVVKIWHLVLGGRAPEVGWAYVALAVVGFVGITGYLPFTVVKLINSIGGLVEKIPGLFKPDED